MNKIKIIEASAAVNYNDAYSHFIDSTQWTEVDDATLVNLRQVVTDRNRLAYRDGKQYILVCEVPPKAEPAKLSVEKFIEEAQTLKKGQEERIKKEQAAQTKRQKTMMERKKAKEKALLEELKRKYEWNQTP